MRSEYLVAERVEAKTVYGRYRTIVFDISNSFACFFFLGKVLIPKT